MYIQNKLITLSETDATGVIFFTQLSKIALETFEHYVVSKGANLFQSKEHLYPIVHFETDFTAPLFAWDEVEAKLELAYLGRRSFTLKTHFEKKGEPVGNTTIVHVVQNVKSKQSAPIPEFLINLLKQI